MKYVKDLGTVRMIACVQLPNMGIGKDNDLLYRSREDLQHFKQYTLGHTVLMGRRTWESLGSKPLPNRHNVVLSSTNPGPGCEWITCLGSMSGRDFTVIGGQRLYEAFAPYADEIVLSCVNGYKEADTFFPSSDSFPQLRYNFGDTSYQDFYLLTYKRSKIS